MCRKLVSCADFRAILMPLSEVIYSTFEKNGKADHYILNWPDVTPQIAFSSTGKVPNLNKSNSSIKPNKFHSKYVCFGGRKSQEEQKISVKLTSSAFLRPFWRGMTTAAHNVVSFSTLIGPFQFERALTTQPSTGGKRTCCRESSVLLGLPRAIFSHLYS